MSGFKSPQPQTFCEMMAHGDIEVEIKVRVEDVAPLIDLMGREGRYEGEVRQADEYFTPAHKDYTSKFPVTEWLRLRDEDGRFSVNYKNYHLNAEGKSVYCDEFETRVEQVEKMRSIFKALDIRPLVKVEKSRRQWAYKDYKVAVDSVAGLGDFVEIELDGRSPDPEKTTSAMVAFLRGLGVGRIRRNYQGYPVLLLFPEKAEYYHE